MRLEWVYDKENGLLVAESNVVPYRHYFIEDGAWWYLRCTQAVGIVPNQGMNMRCDSLADSIQRAEAYEEARLEGVGIDDN